ncbi:Xanthine dehydrogenase/oxidase [Nymphon striatum]|nr:Xanthine dehydrogenase/oxidase [Nymphon striatum]
MLSKYDRNIKKIIHYSVNACLTPVCTVHGLSVTTVEGIGSVKTRLHPVQERIAKSFGSQCGFCTPGIVMSMYTLLRNKTVPSIDDIEKYMQGNLCRCTGYRPIWEGFKTFTQVRGKVKLFGLIGIFLGQISDNLDKQSTCFKSDDIFWYRPLNLGELVQLKANNPEARIRVETKFKNCSYNVMISPSLIIEMNIVNITEDGMQFGAAVSLSTIHETVNELIGKLERKYTLVGNIMTASPISDLNPLMLACGATLTVLSEDGQREVKMDEHFFLSYRKTCIKPKEVIVSIFIPFTRQDEYFYGFKQAKRREDDIAIVNSGMRVQFHPQSDKIREICLAFGGVAATTVFAKSTSKKLQDRKWNMDMFEDAVMQLEEDLPLSPDAPGGMIQFRRSLSTSFFFKFYLNVLNDLQKQQISTEVIPDNYRSALDDVIAPPMSSSQMFKISDDGNEGSVGKPLVNLSAYRQATGEAVYVDDMPKYEGKKICSYCLTINVNLIFLKHN